MSVAVPENGYLDSSGNGWRCERGFRREGSTCSALSVPANAYIDYSGDEWRCIDGFRRQGAQCVANP
jgi:hypothetical protein